MQAMAVVLPSDAVSARRGPCCTDVDMHINTLGPGVTVSTRTAATYRSQVERVMCLFVGDEKRFAIDLTVANTDFGVVHNLGTSVEDR